MPGHDDKLEDRQAKMSDLEMVKIQARTDNYNLWEIVKTELKKIVGDMASDLRNEMKANRTMTEDYFGVTKELLASYRRDHEELEDRVCKIEKILKKD